MKVFLIFGYRQTERHSALAKRWSNGAVRRVTERSGADRYSFPRASVAQTRQLAGCEFEREPRGADCSFDLEAGVGGESIMELAGRPAFVRSASSGIWWFHWAGGESMDSPKTKVREETVPQRSDRFVPAIIFLRAAFPGACWENPCKTARIIIDDPLLTRSYGFLNYDQLFKSLVSLRYGLTTAFIPSNYLRTSRKAARAFAARGDLSQGHPRPVPPRGGDRRCAPRGDRHRRRCPSTRRAPRRALARRWRGRVDTGATTP